LRIEDAPCRVGISRGAEWYGICAHGWRGWNGELSGDTRLDSLCDSKDQVANGSRSRRRKRWTNAESWWCALSRARRCRLAGLRASHDQRNLKKQLERLEDRILPPSEIHLLRVVYVDTNGAKVGRLGDLRKEANMNAITRRVNRLEKTSSARIRPFRLVIGKSWQRLNLETSTCTRTLYPNGHLVEHVDLDGSFKGLSNEGLEQFIARFPIQNAPCQNR